MKFGTILLMMTSAAAAPSALAHAFLQSALPAADATIGSAPAQIDLHFSEALEPAFSSIDVTDASGHDMRATAVIAHGTTMSVSLKSLGTGIYRVKWRAMSVDTHRSEGSYTFKVNP